MYLFSFIFYKALDEYEKLKKKKCLIKDKKLTISLSFNIKSEFLCEAGGAVQRVWPPLNKTRFWSIFLTMFTYCIFNTPQGVDGWIELDI